MLFEEFYENLIAEGKHDPAIFKAVFILGGPGSGKTFLTGRLALTGLGLKLVNSDIAFEHMLRRSKIPMTPDQIYSDLGQQIRGRASTVTDNMQKIYIDRRLGIVIDGTGKTAMKIISQKEALERLGYETFAVIANVDVDTALARNASRERKLPSSEVEKMHAMVRANIPIFHRYFGNSFHVINTGEYSGAERDTFLLFKKLRNWITKPVMTPAAKEWLASEK